MIKRAIPLCGALARLVAIEDINLGVIRENGADGFAAPTTSYLDDVLARMPFVTLYDERKRKSKGKVGDITEYEGGGTSEVIEIGLPIQKVAHSSAALKHSEIALGKAHLRLMGLLQTGKLYAWGSSRVESSDHPASISYRRMMIPTEIWTEKRTVREENERYLRHAAPIPDYSDNSLPVVLNVETGKIEGFRNIEIDADKLEAYLRAVAPVPAVTGGTFSVSRKRYSDQIQSPKDLEATLKIECAGASASIDVSQGFAAIGLLLTKPGDAISWPKLRRASEVFQHGASYKISMDQSGVTDSDRTPSGITSEEIRRLVFELQGLHNQAQNEIEPQRSKTLEKASRLEREISKMKNAKRRTLGSDDKHRQAVYHAMESALSKLAILCPPLARHLGTLHASERRAFQIDTSGPTSTIRYVPEGNVTWMTEPVEVD